MGEELESGQRRGCELVFTSVKFRLGYLERYGVTPLG